MTYADKLKDPRWQKKRLEIMERDEFTCQHCFKTNKTLTVHHLTYRHGQEPWEADATDLLTLCEDCHTEAQEILGKFKELPAVLLSRDARLEDAFAIIEALILNQTLQARSVAMMGMLADFLREGGSEIVGTLAEHHRHTGLAGYLNGVAATKAQQK